MRLLPHMVAEPAVVNVFAERHLLEPPSDFLGAPAATEAMAVQPQWDRFPDGRRIEGRRTIPDAADAGDR